MDTVENNSSVVVEGRVDASGLSRWKVCEVTWPIISDRLCIVFKETFGDDEYDMEEDRKSLTLNIKNASGIAEVEIEEDEDSSVKGVECSQLRRRGSVLRVRLDSVHCPAFWLLCTIRKIHN